MRAGHRIQQAQRRTNKADFPARQAKHLARRTDLDRTVLHPLGLRQTEVRATIKDHMLPDFVAECDQVMVYAQACHGGDLFGIEHPRCRIHRVVEHHHSRSGRDRSLDFGAFNTPVRRLQPNRLDHPARTLDQRTIGVIGRLEDNNLVTGLDPCQQGRRQAFGRTGGHQHLLGGPIGQVQTVVMLGDRGAQFRQATRRRILVPAFYGCVGGRLPQFQRTGRFGKALPQIDGPRLSRQTGHDLENRCLGVGKNRMGEHVRRPLTRRKRPAAKPARKQSEQQSTGARINHATGTTALTLKDLQRHRSVHPSNQSPYSAEIAHKWEEHG